MFGVGRIGSIGSPAHRAPTESGPFNTTCLNFGGTDEYANRADDVAHDFTTAMSLSCWVNGANDADYAGIVVKHDYGSSENSYALLRSGNVAGSAMVIVYDDDGVNVKNYSSSIPCFDNTWHHVVFTFGASTLKIYIDGVEDATPTLTLDGTVDSIKNSIIGLRFGSQLAGGTPSNFYTGKLCSVSLWSKALSQAEIDELYNTGITTDVSLHSAYADCVSWYKAGDGDSNSADGIVDTKSALHLSPTNMENGDIGFADAP